MLEMMNQDQQSISAGTIPQATLKFDLNYSKDLANYKSKALIFSFLQFIIRKSS